MVVSPCIIPSLLQNYGDELNDILNCNSSNNTHTGTTTTTTTINGNTIDDDDNNSSSCTRIAAARTNPSSSFWSKDETSENAVNYLLSLELYQKALEGLSHACTKVALVFTTNAATTTASSSSSNGSNTSDNGNDNKATILSDSLQNPLHSLFVSLRLVISCGTNYHLTKNLESLTRQVLHQLTLFCRQLDKDMTSAEKQALTVITGTIWELTEQAKKIPKSNQIAMKRGLLETVVTIKDTFEELQEFIDEDSGCIDDNDDDGRLIDELENDHDDFNFDMRLNYSEHERLRLFLTILKPIGRLTQSGCQLISKLQVSSVEKETMFSWLAAIGIQYDRLNEAVIDIGPSFYPPQNENELKVQLDNLKGCSLVLLEQLRNFPGSISSNEPPIVFTIPEIDEIVSQIMSSFVP